MTINDLFESTEPIKKKRKRILLVDFSALSHSTFFVVKSDPTLTSEEDLINIWRHTILLSILTRKNTICPDEIVLCLDYGSWRNDFFKYYKASRKADKAASDIDYQFFYDASDKFLKEIRETFPWLIISERGAEGDDCIAILAHELSKENDVVVMSSDKDLKQLLYLKNVKFYSYRDDEFQTIDNPKEYIIRHILLGDATDGIMNIRNPGNCFVAGIRQLPLGPKTVDKILIEGLEEYLDKNNLHDNYKRNKTLIELNKNTIPEDIWDNVVDKYNNYDRIKTDFTKMLIFFNKNKLIKLRERINEFLN